MLQQAVLDGILFVPPPRPSSQSTEPPLPSNLLRSILRTLSSLSFVIVTFGGVTAGAGSNADGEGPSFPELKKVFYMAVDILAADKINSEDFVKDLISGVDSGESERSLTH